MINNVEKSDDVLISETKNWVKKVVIDHNFCPFANQEFINNRIKYEVVRSESFQKILDVLYTEFQYLDEHHEISTTLLIIPYSLEDFEDFLDLIEVAEELLEDEDYEGVYQLATFHPQYIFDQVEESDPSNYTNRSLYPMLHILREAQISKVVDNFPQVHTIPQKNVELCLAKGLEYMKKLREDCLEQ